MKRVKPLSEAESATLRDMREHHASRRARMRAFALILSHDGYTIQEIASIFDVRRQTVSSWIDQWEEKGLSGLLDVPREGRPLKLSREDRQFIGAQMANEPRSIKKILALLHEQRGKQVSEWTVKRALEKSNLSQTGKSFKAEQDERKPQRGKGKAHRLES